MKNTCRRISFVFALAGLTSAASAADLTAPRDNFYWLNEQNKASVIVLKEEGIISKPLAGTIARSLQQVILRGEQPGAPRPTDYLQIEAEMITIGGAEVSRIHSGRSRQDLGVTTTRLNLREALLDTYAQFIDARQSLLELAQAHLDELLPFYTNGVQAQPTTVGHYLGGYVQALTRGSDRYQQAWARLNLSPLGGGAGATSSFPLNRPRLAELLGFDGIVVNSFDSGQIAPQDLGVEISFLAASGALTLSMLSADLTVQYADPQPWFQLKEGDQTGISSMMPQKRNPSGLTRLHATSSTVVGEAMSYLVQSNNVMAGMADYKGGMPLQAIRSTGIMYRDFGKLIRALEFHPQRAAEEVNNDYATTTELADTLQRDANVPFRVGHHFASELVSYGREHKLKPSEIGFHVAQQLFKEASESSEFAGSSLPLSETHFREALSARHMTHAAKPVGGPQQQEVTRMLQLEQKRILNDREWLATVRAKLERAAKLRDKELARLAEEKT